MTEQTAMFWRVLGFVAVLLGSAAWGVAQDSWIERMVARVNLSRPPDQRLLPFGFQGYRAMREFRRLDPGAYWKGMAGFGLSGLLLLGAMVWLTS